MKPEVLVESVDVATVRADLPAPVVFGDWIMNYREYAVVRLGLSNGVRGWAFSLTRDGAVAEQIRKTIGHTYVGSSVEERQRTYETARRRSLASHSSGVGLRALSLVDLAAWDAAARTEDVSIATLLGGTTRAMPATAIIGYPPATMGPEEVATQVATLYTEGWRRFKAPVAESEDGTAARLRAARRSAPDAWIGCDGAWTFDSVDRAATFLASVADVELGWFEDVFPPGDAHVVAALRRRTNTRIAMGDEQGGSYYPQALLDNDAVDVVRIDLTCMGGITGGRAIVDACRARNVEFAPHMFAHVHSQVFSAWGESECPVEWGIPWTGVDPFADSLRQPTILQDGRMQPLPDEPGFGPLVNVEWLSTQQCDDPQGILQGDSNVGA